jgi:hypothetical protein
VLEESGFELLVPLWMRVSLSERDGNNESSRAM